MTPRQRVLRALEGGHADKVPFTMYENKIPQCTAEREMRNRGMCIVYRKVPVVKTHRPNVKTTSNFYWEGPKQFERITIETPAGTLTSLRQPVGFTTWAHEKLFKTPEDYKAILFYIQDAQFEPNYEAFAGAQEELGEDFICRAGFGLEPLQEFISGNIMAMQTFCLEWMDRRDEVLKLYEANVANRRKIYSMVADSPALFANYGGNVTPEIVSPEMFEQYYLPHYQEAAEIMHARGKLIGCHLDANCKPLSELIGRTDLDYIEAFTPAPDTDMTLGEARAAWGGKVLWLNFPSSVHLKSDEQVEAATVDLLGELDSIDGVLMSITEDIPPDRWRGSCKAIMDGLERHARRNPSLYT